MYNKGNHLLEAFGFTQASFSMKPYTSNPSFTAAHGAGWYYANSSSGFAGHYKAAVDQKGDWRARQMASVAGLVAARAAAALKVAARKAAEGGGGGGGGGGGP